MMQISKVHSYHKTLNSISIPTMVFFIFLLIGCAGNEPKEPQKIQAPAPGKVTLKDGLIPINKTRDFTLFASVKDGKVTGWEIQDTSGNPMDIIYKQETKGDLRTIKCMACIEYEDEGYATTSKCWEIPCDSMPNSGK